MRTKKIILQTRSSGQKCSFSKATFQNRTDTDLKTELLSVLLPWVPTLSSSQCNVKWPRSPLGACSGGGGGGQSNRKSMWNWTVLKPNYFTHIILLSWTYISEKWKPSILPSDGLGLKKSEMVVVKFFKWVKNTIVILMLNAKHCDKIVTSSLLILAAHTEAAL